MAATRVVAAAPAAAAASTVVAASGTAKKSGATAAVPAAKGKAPPAAPTAAASRAVSSASAGAASSAAPAAGGPSLCIWDVLTAKELAGAVTALPSRLDPATPGSAPLLASLVATLALAISSGRAAAFPKAYVASALADLSGVAGAAADGTGVAAEAPRRAASPLFAALVQLMGHEIAAVRKQAASRVAEVSDPGLLGSSARFRVTHGAPV